MCRATLCKPSCVLHRQQPAHPTRGASSHDVVAPTADCMCVEAAPRAIGGLLRGPARPRRRTHAPSPTIHFSVWLRFGRVRTKFGHVPTIVLSKSANVGPKLADSGPMSANAKQMLAEFIVFRAKVGRFRANSGGFRTFDRIRPIRGHIWSIPGRIWSKLVPQICRNRPKFGRFRGKLADAGRTRHKLGHAWPEFNRIRPVSGPFRPNSTHIRPNLCDSDRS